MPSSTSTFASLSGDELPSDVTHSSNQTLRSNRNRIFSSPRMMRVNKVESEWRTYRSKYLIQATQLSQPLSFTDALGREHRGAKGDYLVQSANGAQRIWPRGLFEDSYVFLESASDLPDPVSLTTDSFDSLRPGSPSLADCSLRKPSIRLKKRPMRNLMVEKACVQHASWPLIALIHNM